MRGLVVGAAVALGSPAFADPPVAGTAERELSERLDAIEARLARVEAGTARGLLAEHRAQATRALVLEVLADADRRSSLLDEAMRSGHDGNFFLETADGRFRLQVAGQLQIRFVYNRRQEDGADTVTDFDIRRAKVDVRGHVLTPDLQYRVTIAERSAGFMLETAYVRYEPLDDVTLQAGRFRPPLIREEEVSSRRQLLAERSLVARTFNQRRSNGFTGRVETDDVRVTVGIFDAEPGFENDGWIASARALVRLWGDLRELRDFSSFPGDKPTGGLGIGLGYADVDPIDPTEPDTRTWRWTVDLSLEFGGATAMAAFIGNYAEEPGQPTQDQYGLVVQGGVFVADGWELVGRYEWGDADQVAPDLSVLTIGFNRFVRDHRLKATVDVGYSFGEVGGFWSSRNAGWLADDEDGELVVRAQTQLLF